MASNVFGGRKGYITIASASSVSVAKFGALRDWELGVSNATIAVTHQDSSAWTERLTGTRSWTFRAAMVWLSTAATHKQSQLRGMLSSGKRNWFEFRNSTGTGTTGTQTFKGWGFMQNWAWNGDIENVQLFNVAVEGDGKITES